MKNFFKKIFSSRKKTIITLLSVLVVFVLGFLIWRLFIYNPPTKPLPPIEEQTLRADTLLQQGKIDEAKKAYDEVIGLAETSKLKADAIEQKALACSNYGDEECALDSVDKFKKYNNSTYEVTLLNAIVLNNSGKSEQAKSEFKKVLDILNRKASLTEEEKLVKQNAESYAE